MLKTIMDNQPTGVIPPDQQLPPSPIPSPVEPTPTPIMPVNPKRSRGLLLGCVALIILIVAVAGVYEWQHSKVKSLETKLASTSTAQAPSLGQQYLYLNSYGLRIPLTKDIQDLYYTDLKSSDSDLLSFSTQSLTNAEPSCMAVPNNYLYSYQPLDLNKPATQTSMQPPFGYVTVTAKALPASQVGTTDDKAGAFITQAGGYYFYFQHVQSTCLSFNATTNKPNQADSELLTTQATSFLAALKNIEPIK